MAQILAAATTAGNSSDVVVTTDPKTVSLFSGESNGSMARCKLSIYQKDSAGNYHRYTIQRGAKKSADELYLTNVQRAVVLSNPGTFRVVRPITTTSVGVDAD